MKYSYLVLPGDAVYPATVNACYPATGYSLLPRELSDYRAASGAQDIRPLVPLSEYLTDQQLDYRVYPALPKQNAGTGSTLYGFGNATANHGTIIGAQWSVGGLVLTAANSDLIRIADFIGTEELNIFLRCDKDNQPTATTALIAQYDSGVDDRSWMLAQGGAETGDPLQIFRSSDGQFGAAVDIHNGANTGLGTDTCFVLGLANGAAPTLDRNLDPVSLTLASGTASNTRHDSAADITIGAFLNSDTGTAFSNMTLICALFVLGSIDTGQRIAITNLINAL